MPLMQVGSGALSKHRVRLGLALALAALPLRASIAQPATPALRLGLHAVRSDVASTAERGLRETLAASFQRMLSKDDTGGEWLDTDELPKDAVVIDVHLEQRPVAGREKVDPPRYLFIFDLSLGSNFHDRVAFEQRHPVLRPLGADTMTRAVLRKAEALAAQNRPAGRGPVEEVAVTAAQVDAGVAAVATDPALESALPSLAAVHTDLPPTLDGAIDEPMWATAGETTHFLWRLGKPYGQAFSEPTRVKVAYDEKNLYVAFECGYTDDAPRDDAFPVGEEDAATSSEVVGIFIDARNDRTNSKAFLVTRTGYRSDAAFTYDGSDSNFDWHERWQAAARADEKGWSAELAIPWGTMGLATPSGAFSVGANFVRFSVGTHHDATWAPYPPAFDSWPPPSQYGQIEVPTAVSPGERLLIAPYVAVGYKPAGTSLNTFRDFTNQPYLAPYAGGYGYVRMSSALQLHWAVNPDFSQANPDPALTRLDRFELVLPETRDLFVAERGLFEFGSPSYQLFYSRRIGLMQNAAGTYDQLPIPWAVKGLLRAGGTEVGIMNVSVAPSTGPASIESDYTIARFNQNFGDGRRLGAMVLSQFTPGGVPYFAYGLDGAWSAFDHHLLASAFAATTSSNGVPASFAGNAMLGFSSQEFAASASYLTVSNSFDPRLGYFEETGIRRADLTAEYKPLLNSDWVRRVHLIGTLSRVTDQHESPIYDRQSLTASVDLENRSTFSVSLNHSADTVVTPFTLAGGRVNVALGNYDALVGAFEFDSPPRRLFEVGLTYNEGGLFDGYQRGPGARLALNWRHLTVTAQYQFLLLTFAPQSITGHRLSARLTVTFTPDLQTILSSELNTVDPDAVLQWVTIWHFGNGLHSLSLVVNQSAPAVGELFGHPAFQVIAKISIGLMPF